MGKGKIYTETFLAFYLTTYAVIYNPLDRVDILYFLLQPFLLLIPLIVLVAMAEYGYRNEKINRPFMVITVGVTAFGISAALMEFISYYYQNDEMLQRVFGFFFLTGYVASPLYCVGSLLVLFLTMRYGKEITRAGASLKNQISSLAAHKKEAVVVCVSVIFSVCVAFSIFYAAVYWLLPVHQLRDIRCFLITGVVVFGVTSLCEIVVRKKCLIPSGLYLGIYSSVYLVLLIVFGVCKSRIDGLQDFTVVIYAALYFVTVFAVRFIVELVRALVHK